MQCGGLRSQVLLFHESLEEATQKPEPSFQGRAQGTSALTRPLSHDESILQALFGAHKHMPATLNPDPSKRYLDPTI